MRNISRRVGSIAAISLLAACVACEAPEPQEEASGDKPTLLFEPPSNGEASLRDPARKAVEENTQAEAQLKAAEPEERAVSVAIQRADVRYCDKETGEQLVMPADMAEKGLPEWVEPCPDDK